MKLRLVPVLISVVVTALLLFGGWFIYHSLAMEDPLIQIVDQYPGVQEVKIDIGGDAITARLSLSEAADLGDIVNGLRRDGANVLGARKLALQVKDQSTPELDRWWSQMLFDVAQAMETKQYSLIPDLLQNNLASGMEASSVMDDEHVYIKIAKNDKVKFVILDRAPAAMGVFAYE